MTTTPDLPTAGHGQAADAAYADGVLAGRAMSAGEYLAGLVMHGQLETVARPDRLPEDLFSHVPAEVVRAVWERALAVGFYAGRVSATPRLYRDEMDRVQGELAAIGFEAMARSVGRSRRLVAAHPADGETARDGRAGVTSRTNDTS
ncbi:hypothetical protein AB0M00_43840 [Streptomyces chartreusis]|uniref:hypothetical protein n=1 Tax=Streptomyces chartreusis TaxID=1969 RepID=UPI00344011DF